jgi:hypothetical protein
MLIPRKKVLLEKLGVAQLTKYTMSSSFFWEVNQQWFIVSYEWFETAYQSHCHGSGIPRRLLSRHFCNYLQTYAM